MMKSTKQINVAFAAALCLCGWSVFAQAPKTVNPLRSAQKSLEPIRLATSTDNSQDNAITFGIAVSEPATETRTEAQPNSGNAPRLLATPSNNSLADANPFANDFSSPEPETAPSNIFDAESPKVIANVPNIPSARRLVHENFSEAAPLKKVEDEATGTPGAKHLEGPQTPELMLEKISPPEIIVDHPFVFKTVIRNTGKMAARDVVVFDRIPAGTRLLEATPKADVTKSGQLIWEFGVLEPNQEKIIEMKLLPIQEGEIGSIAQVSFSVEATSRSLATKPMIKLDVKKPESAVIGQPIPFEITISNPGSGVATNVVLTEVVPDGLIHEKGRELINRVGDIKPGEQRRFILTMNSSKSGVITNTLNVKADYDIYVEDTSEIEILAPVLELQIAGSKQRYLDRRAVYQLTVSNPGTAPAMGVDLSLALPQGLKFESTNQSGIYDPQTHTVHWALETLPTKGAGQIELVTIPVKPGDHRLKFTGSGETDLRAEAVHDVSIDGLAATSFEIKCLTDTVEIGKNAVYEIRVVNRGTKAATNIAVVAQLSQGMTFVDANGPSQATENNGTVQFRPVTTLDPKEERVFKIVTKCNAAGDHRLLAQLLADDLQAPVTKEESTRVFD